MFKFFGWINRNKFEVLFLLVLTILNSFFVFSQPVVPTIIDGYIFLDTGLGAPNGVPVIVNNTNTNRIFTTEVDAPPIPTLMGIYSLAIEATVGHEILVRAYNDTHYGETIKVISSSSAQINVTMNISRPAELLVNFVSPLSNGLVSPNSDFNVSVNITSIINTASTCEAVLFISNTSVMNFKNGNTNFISEILKDETITTIFELESYNQGVSDLEVVVSCASDGVVFEGNNRDEVTNVSVIDDEPPIVSLISPGNNSVERASNNISFVYIVEDVSPISECRLFVNDSVVDTHFGVDRDVEQTFLVNLNNDYYSWYVECDDPSFTGSSGIYYLDVSVFFPVIENIDILGTINLNPGTTKEVVCNVNVSDGNGIDDISLVQAILHLEGISDFSQNNNQVYIDNNCNFIGQTSNLAEYSCSFNVQYYANNGTWLCNVTATDNQGLQGNDFEDTIIDELYAINLSALQIDFGDIPAGSISDEREVDIFNIGNMPLNIFVRGYGGDDPVLGDGFAMLCSDAQSVPVGNQRFSNTENILFNDKSQLSSSFSTIISNLEKQTTTSMISQTTYWELLAPPISVTDCEGTIVFSVTG